jgi:hypothetical protein
VASALRAEIAGVGGGKVAKATKGSLAVRAVALVCAVVLAALAAHLWLRSAPREASTPSAADGESARERAEAGDGAPDAISTEPPLHREHSAEDQESLRGILRGSEGEAP